MLTLTSPHRQQNPSSICCLDRNQSGISVTSSAPLGGREDGLWGTLTRQTRADAYHSPAGALMGHNDSTIPFK